LSETVKSRPLRNGITEAGKYPGITVRMIAASSAPGFDGSRPSIFTEVPLTPEQM
jgi:hypothetical protein